MDRPNKESRFFPSLDAKVVLKWKVNCFCVKIKEKKEADLGM